VLFHRYSSLHRMGKGTAGLVDGSFIAERKPPLSSLERVAKVVQVKHLAILWYDRLNRRRKEELQLGIIEIGMWGYVNSAL
jgi:hypothetical protein